MPLVECKNCGGQGRGPGWEMFCAVCQGFGSVYVYADPEDEDEDDDEDDSDIERTPIHKETYSTETANEGTEADRPATGRPRSG